VTAGPGDTLAVRGGGLGVETYAGERPSDDLGEYSRRRAAEWGEFHAEPERPITRDEIADYFKTLQRRNRHLARDLSKKIQLVAGGKAWQVKLGELAQDYVIEGEEPYEVDYSLLMPTRVLRAVLDGRTGWEEALLSMRVNLRRDPDVFDSKLMGLLRYGNEPAQTLQMIRESRCNEFIVRDGVRMPRYCPHAGEDLTHAPICNGVIECPRHHWKWDATTGECIEGGDLKLCVSPAPEACTEQQAVREPAAAG
jgi:UDP-MurNAc hydroxylase